MSDVNQAGRDEPALQSSPGRSATSPCHVHGGSTFVADDGQGHPGRWACGSVTDRVYCQRVIEYRCSSTEQPGLDRRRRLVDELIEELVSTPREKMDAYRRWHRGRPQPGPPERPERARGRRADLDGPAGRGARRVGRQRHRYRQPDDRSGAWSNGATTATDRRVVLVHLTEAGSRSSTSLEEHHRERLGGPPRASSAAEEMTGLLTRPASSPRSPQPAGWPDVDGRALPAGAGR